MYLDATLHLAPWDTAESEKPLYSLFSRTQSDIISETLLNGN